MAHAAMKRSFAAASRSLSQLGGSLAGTLRSRPAPSALEEENEQLKRNLLSAFEESRTQIEALTANLAAVEQDRAQLEQRVAQLEEQLAAAGDASSFQHQSASAPEALHRRLAELESLVARQASVLADHEALDARYDTLVQQFAALSPPMLLDGAVQDDQHAQLLQQLEETRRQREALLLPPGDAGQSPTAPAQELAEAGTEAAAAMLAEVPVADSATTTATPVSAEASDAPASMAAVVEQLRAKLRRKQESYNSLQTEKEQQYAHFQQIIADLTQERDQTVSQSATAAEAAAQMETQLQGAARDMQQQLDAASQARRAQEQEIEQLKETIRAHEALQKSSQCEALQVEADSLTMRLLAMQSQLADKEAELTRTEQLYRQTAQSHTQLTGRLQELEVALDEAQKLAEKRKQLLDEMSIQQSDAQQRLQAQLAETRQSAQQQLDDARRQHQEELARLREKHERTSRDRDALGAQLAAVQEERTRLLREADEARLRLAQLQSDYDANQAKVRWPTAATIPCRLPKCMRSRVRARTRSSSMQHWHRCGSNRIPSARSGSRQMKRLQRSLASEMPIRYAKCETASGSCNTSPRSTTAIPAVNANVLGKAKLPACHGYDVAMQAVQWMAVGGLFTVMTPSRSMRLRPSRVRWHAAAALTPFTGRTGRGASRPWKGRLRMQEPRRTWHRRKWPHSWRI